ncbi:redoxin domain-containing protein [Candidatus Poribacteria bacterium]|nr:redoxin domain-containing protein [Candidatus Poribacteria bacterium]
MRNVLKVASFAFALTLAGGLVAAGDGSGTKAASGGDKKAQAECMMPAGEKSCPPGCTMACCAGKGEAKEASNKEKGEKTAAYGLGSEVEAFTLENAATGEMKSLKDVAGSKATVLVFWNQNCPFVQECDDRIAEFQKTYADKGVNVVAVDAGIANKKDEIKTHAATMPFPVLVNDDSTIAAKFNARHTPEVFILDADQKVVYHGAFDSGKTMPERKAYVQNAVDELLEGKQVSVAETKAFGCSLKYAKGARPEA